MEYFNTRFIIINMKIVRQHDSQDCGAACIAMIAGYYGLKYPFGKFRNLVRTDFQGTTIHDILIAARTIGLNGEGHYGNSKDILKAMKSSEIQCPFIAHTIVDNSLMHYVVVFKLTSKYVVVGDPATGKVKLKFSDFCKIWTGYIITFEPSESFLKGNYVDGVFARFWPLLKGQIKRVGKIFVLSILTSMLGLISALMLEVLIDKFISGKFFDINKNIHQHAETTSNIINCLRRLDEFASDIVNLDTISCIFIFFIILAIVQAVIGFMRGYLISSIAKDLDSKIGGKYCKDILDLPLDNILSRQTGEYLSRLTDTITVRQAISKSTLTLLLDTLSVFLCSIALIVINIKMFVGTLIIIMCYILIIVLLRKPLYNVNRLLMIKSACLQSYFKEMIDGIETIKSLNMTRAVKEKVETKFVDYVCIDFENNLVEILQQVVSGTIEIVGTIVTLWFGISLVISKQESIGSVVSFYVILGYLLQPTKNLFELQPVIQKASIALDRLDDILDNKKEKLELSKKLECFKNIELRAVSHNYGNNSFGLKNVNLNINKSDKVAFIGESGSGKSTLAKLLVRYHESCSGEILYNGIDIQQIDYELLRNNIVYIGQQIFFFADTIKNNLKIGNENVTDQDIVKVCQLCQIHKFIDELPFKYNTYLEENGLNLSVGQRQRLALARVLLKKPEVLILDEITAGIDGAMANEIYNMLFQYYGNLTYIIISHDTSVISKCDKVFIVNDGNVCEIKNNNLLLNRN